VRLLGSLSQHDRRLAALSNGPDAASAHRLTGPNLPTHHAKNGLTHLQLANSSVPSSRRIIFSTKVFVGGEGQVRQPILEFVT
jgi:hypothetical protein